MDRYWMDWKFPGIYIITHAASGKKYVGQSSNIARRINDHMRHMDARSYLTKAMKLYGNEEFEVVVAERVDDINQLTEREQWWIDVLDSANREHGYNIAPAAGSLLGYRHTDEAKAKIGTASRGRTRTLETREKMSIALMEKFSDPEYRAKLSARTREYYEGNPDARTSGSLRQIGHEVTLETREKLRIAHTGRRATAETCKKLSEISKAVWARERELGVERSAMSGKSHSAETKEKISISQRARFESPEAHVKASAAKREYYSNPDNRAKLKATLNTPEYRAKQGAASKAAWARKRAAQQDGSNE